MHITGQQDALKITSWEVQKNSVNLSWEGGEPSYEIQATANFQKWRTIHTTDELNASINLNPTHEFIRILGRNNQIPKGEFLGQIRTAQGEFNDPLEIHRLKSIWNFFLPPDTDDISKVPTTFFENLILERTYLSRDGTHTMESKGTFTSLPEVRIQRGTRDLIINWTETEGEETRSFKLELSFPYPIKSTRNQTIHLSDPQWKFSCQYSTPNPEIEYWPSLKTKLTSEDSIILYELADDQKTPQWYNIRHTVNIKPVTIRSSYQLGVPNYGGSLAFIFKTPVMLNWNFSSVEGITDETFRLDGYFSQTYQPGHHNFWENFILDPYLEEGIDAAILAQLREKNIRYIYFLAERFGDRQSIAYIGFDGSVRAFK